MICIWSCLTPKSVFIIKAFTKTKKGLIRKCEMYKLNFFLEDNKVLVNEGRYYIPSNASKRSYRVVYRHKALNLLSGLKSYAYRLLKLEKNTIREPLFLEMMTRVVCDGMTLVEVGSDDGFEANFIAKKFPNKSINFYIVEPDKRNINNIKKNLSKLKKVVFINKAISNINKKSGDFYLSKGRSNLNSLSRGGEADQKISVGYVTLDNLMESLNVSSPVMVKMDIEGHEVEVLEGFFDYCKNNSNIFILMEVHPNFYSGSHSMKCVLRHLFDLGFKVRYLESAGSTCPEVFQKKALRPIATSGHRGLYENIDREFALEVVTKNIQDKTKMINGLTVKVSRSILLEKSNGN